MFRHPLISVDPRQYFENQYPNSCDKKQYGLVIALPEIHVII